MGRKNVGRLSLVPVLLLTAVSTWRVWSKRAVHVRTIFDDLEQGSQLPCLDLAGAVDTLVVLKT